MTSSESRELWLIKPSDLGYALPSSSAEMDLRPLGSPEEVKRALAKLGEATWLDPWAAVVDGDGWMAEISLRVGSPIQELTLRIHGRGQPPEIAFDGVRAVCNENGWRAIDLEAWAVLV